MCFQRRSMHPEILGLSAARVGARLCRRPAAAIGGINVRRLLEDETAALPLTTSVST